jgi:hypothetical protein
MRKKMILLFSAVYFVTLAILAILIYRASPGPISQEILGVGIGDYHGDAGIVYLSGRWLHCTRPEGSPSLMSTCTVEIAGKTLEIHAQRNPATHPNQLSGTCEASYDGKQWPCHIGSRHVHVHWFAYLSEPLGLDQTQLKALRREYFFENLPDQIFITGGIAVPVATMIVAVLATAAWLWPRSRSKVVLALITAASGIASLAGSFILSLFLTRGFWD